MFYPKKLKSKNKKLEAVLFFFSCPKHHRALKISQLQVLCQYYLTDKI